jgi:hypothetical protein
VPRQLSSRVGLGQTAGERLKLSARRARHAQSLASETDKGCIIPDARTV